MEYCIKFKFIKNFGRKIKKFCGYDMLVRISKFYRLWVWKLKVEISKDYDLIGNVDLEIEEIVNYKSGNFWVIVMYLKYLCIIWILYVIFIIIVGF